MKYLPRIFGITFLVLTLVNYSGRLFSEEIASGLESNNEPLILAQKVDYTRLRDLLRRGQWQEADKETRMVILRLAGYSRRSAWLRDRDARNFSCQDLSTIDKLWLKYSKGNFGFSVQKQIYRSLGGMRGLDARRAYEVWKKFGDRVGWRKGGKWLLYKRLTYSKMRRGFLPIRMNVAGSPSTGMGVRNGRFWRILARCKNL
ncbi:MAG: GUN4 domain-containing protein [Okeania sp. SIO3B5]|uniref:GUN4 domain-containing protein n=1 Tax=Okeania sp. SIO3B5 TaxID=2607811 RepID=UPI0013FF7E80|nr:GUN4 domain-containing protein [Okeania sp. SIO3B5]NEO51852.1 GUN4 domain-containing protein [Okeania sp. SIO3B5]